VGGRPMRDRRAARRGARRTAELRRRRSGPARRGAHSPLGGRTAAERYHGGALTALELQICARWVIGGGSPLSARLLLTGRGGWRPLRRPTERARAAGDSTPDPERAHQRRLIFFPRAPTGGNKAAAAQRSPSRAHVNHGKQ
jgi:hypothetical protein